MIYLIVGQPRSGKSQFAVKTAFDIKDENDRIQKKLDEGKELKENELMELSDGSIVPAIRPVFSDIDEHAQRNDFISLAPQDWREVQDGSVIFYDEVHFRDEYLDQNKYMSQNPMIKELSIHGHRNIDIYLMTQDPRRLEKSIRALIFKMYLVKRPANLPPFANIYTFDKWLGDPWAASKNPDNVHDTKIFKYKKKFQDAYKSASSHTSISFKLQNKFIVAIISIICMIGLSIFLFKISGMGQVVSNAMNAGEISETTKVDKDKIMASAYGKTGQELSSSQGANLDCRKAVNIDLPACKDFYNNLSNSKGSVSTGDNGRMIVSYNPNKPFDDENILQTVTYEVSAKPVFSGCTHFNGQYTAYTQQGTRLKVSASDCKRLISDADRPFNYFAKEQPNKEPTKPETDKDEESSEYKKAFRENRARIDAEKMYLAQHAQVKPEPFDTNHVETKYLDSANRY